MMLLMGMWMSFRQLGLRAHDDVVDGDVDELDKEPNEAHYAKAYCSGNSNLGELFPVRLCAPFDQPYGVLAELLQRLQVLLDLIHRNIQALSCRSESSNKSL